MDILEARVSQWDLEQLIAEYGYQYIEGGAYPDGIVVSAVKGDKVVWLGAKKMLLACGSIEYLRKYRMHLLVE